MVEAQQRAMEMERHVSKVVAKRKCAILDRVNVEIWCEKYV
jgi:hypothetical protein